ncbi:MAG: hypothetical protein HFG20_05715 [Anaerotruncus sp.]|nr:hypothetical protein [Anaerotruncus sp.]
MQLVAASQIYKIDGWEPPAPSSASVSMEDLEADAYRDASGVLHRERARQGLRKVSFGYDALSQQQLSELLSHLSGAFFELTYQDPEFGVHTIECYCSSKSAELYSAFLYDGVWQSIQFNCIER